MVPQWCPNGAPHGAPHGAPLIFARKMTHQLIHKRICVAIAFSYVLADLHFPRKYEWGTMWGTIWGTIGAPLGHHWGTMKNCSGNASVKLEAIFLQLDAHSDSRNRDGRLHDRNIIDSRNHINRLKAVKTAVFTTVMSVLYTDGRMTAAHK